MLSESVRLCPGYYGGGGGLGQWVGEVGRGPDYSMGVRLSLAQDSRMLWTSSSVAPEPEILISCFSSCIRTRRYSGSKKLELSGLRTTKPVVPPAVLVASVEVNRLLLLRDPGDPGCIVGIVGDPVKELLLKTTAQHPRQHIPKRQVLHGQGRRSPISSFN